MKRLILGGTLIALAPAALVVGAAHIVLVFAVDATEQMMALYERAGRMM